MIGSNLPAHKTTVCLQQMRHLKMHIHMYMYIVIIFLDITAANLNMLISRSDRCIVELIVTTNFLLYWPTMKIFQNTCFYLSIFTLTCM